MNIAIEIMDGFAFGGDGVTANIDPVRIGYVWELSPEFPQRWPRAREKPILKIAAKDDATVCQMLWKWFEDGKPDLKTLLPGVQTSEDAPNIDT